MKATNKEEVIDWIRKERDRLASPASVFSARLRGKEMDWECLK